MYLPEDEPEAMEMFTSFLYQGNVVKFPNPDTPKISMATAELEKFRDHRILLSKSYFLGEKYCINDFVDLIMDELQGFVVRY